MVLEIGFLQKLILYLAHPIYSAAVAIAAFLVFAGVGSQISARRQASPRRILLLAGGAVAGLSLLYVFVLDEWFALTQMCPLSVRVLIAAGTIAPLALAMGHMFPTGLRAVGGSRPALIPWAWAVNGFASVAATAAAPLLAMEIGFRRLTLLAVGCYALAALLARFLPGTASTTEAQGSQRVEDG